MGNVDALLTFFRFHAFSVLFKMLQHMIQGVAGENAHDGRRRLVGTQAVIVSCTGDAGT